MAAFGSEPPLLYNHHRRGSRLFNAGDQAAMAVDVRQIFDNAAADYDRLRRQLVPNFDDFYGTALERIPYMQDATFRVLDQGAPGCSRR
ncbi:MAG: hypothetical protein LC121_10010 [Anaerolineae bacterium]|nr:hypothetical protein [Anaerolineae bacterium]